VIPVRRIGEILGGGALLVFAVVWLSGGCEQKTPPGVAEVPAATAPAGATTARVEEQTVAGREWVAGEVASARQTAVSARVLARIEEIRVAAGSRVREGDVLVVLDARDLRAAVGAAEEALLSARARLELATSEHARIEQLLARGVAPQRQLDQAISELRAARADVMGLEETVDKAKTALSYAEIRAPVGGRVVDRLAEPGDTATPGTPLLRIYDPSLLRVEVPVRESLAVDLSIGQALPVEVPALETELDGVVDEIVPFAEPGARTLLVKVRVVSPDERLFAGMYARVSVPAGERRLVVVPQTALHRIGQLSYVDVVTEGRGRERRLVTVGPVQADGRVEILSGLAAGEQVWVTGATDGAAHRTAPGPPPLASALDAPAREGGRSG
jgi:RND family efflux transporter MFP subunit